MAGLFKKLRKKPKHVRDNIAFSIAGGFTFVVALSWFFLGFHGLPQGADVASEESNGAFSTLFGQIQEQVAAAKESIEEAKKVATTTPVVTGEWGLASTTRVEKEAAIMIVTSSSTGSASSTRATTSVLY